MSKKSFVLSIFLFFFFSFNAFPTHNCDSTYADMFIAADTSILKNIESDCDGYIVSLKQLSSTNPNGGGLFVQRDSIYKEGVVAYDHPTNGKQWVRLESLNKPKEYNVLWAGCLDDGITDMSTNFFNLCNNLAEDSSTIYIPDGHFVLSSGDTIEKELYVKGAGIGQTFVDCGDFSNIIRVGNNLKISDIRFENFKYLITDIPAQWKSDTLEYLFIDNCYFYNGNICLNGSTYDSTKLLKNLSVKNNIVEKCENGFQMKAKTHTQSYIGNQGSQMYFNNSVGVFYFIYAGTPTQSPGRVEGYGSISITGNTVDSVIVDTLSGASEHMTFFVYGDRVTFSGNSIGNQRVIRTDGKNRMVGALYCAGKHAVVDGNVFYNSSEGSYQSATQVLFLKGETGLPKDRIISNNIFWNSVDSAGYSIHMRGIGQIMNNVFYDSTTNDIGQYTLRLGATSGTTPEYSTPDKNCIVSGNVVPYTNRDFISLGNFSNAVISDNTVNRVGNNEVKFIRGNIMNSGDQENLIIKNNNINGGMFIHRFGGSVNYYKISNNYIKSDTTIIDINSGYNMDVNNNTFILDTTGTVTANVIDVYPLNDLSVVKWTNNTHIFRGTLTESESFVHFSGGNWFSSDNIFIMDSVANVDNLAIAYLRNGTNTSKIVLSEDKFITLGSQKWNRSFTSGNQILTHLEVHNCYFDANVVIGITNYGTITDGHFTNNTWKGSNSFISNSGTITNLFEYLNPGYNTVVGNSMRFIWDSDTLYIYK